MRIVIWKFGKNKPEEWAAEINLRELAGDPGKGGWGMKGKKV